MCCCPRQGAKQEISNPSFLKSAPASTQTGGQKAKSDRAFDSINAVEVERDTINQTRWDGVGISVVTMKTFSLGKRFLFY